MFELETSLSEWEEMMLEAEPRLAPHIEEMGDHLRAVVEDQAAAGVDAAIAFSVAVERLGSASSLAEEYRRAKHLLRRACDDVLLDPTGRRQSLAVGVAHIGTSLVWAGAMIAFGNVNWMIVGWMTTSFLPLSALTARLEARKA